MEWSEEKIENFQLDILSWYAKNKKALPWRKGTEAYHVWISEIMSQQTKVETVLPYYERFMVKYPNIAALAIAKDEELLKLWEGLGYYHRARNLKIAARQIITDFDEKFPTSLEEIKRLKGIGAYTAAAIASISFNLPEPAIDGNLFRVTSRLFELEADISKGKSRRIFDERLRRIISQEEAGNFNQAFMDLGSMICKPKLPECERCPINKYCLAYIHGTQENFPVKSKKLKQISIYYQAFAISNHLGEWLLQQRPSEGLLASMWTFPMLEVEENSKVRLPDILKDRVLRTIEIGEVTHIFSHQKWHIRLFYCSRESGLINETIENYKSNDYAWASESGLSEFALAGPQVKMFKLLEKSGL